eukprot:6083757-Heterocapsa_arctica.AAC.1
MRVGLQAHLSEPSGSPSSTDSAVAARLMDTLANAPSQFAPGSAASGSGLGRGGEQRRDLPEPDAETRNRGRPIGKAKPKAKD